MVKGRGLGRGDRMRRSEIFSDGQHDQKAVTQLPAACETTSDGRAADTGATFKQDDNEFNIFNAVRVELVPSTSRHDHQSDTANYSSK